MIGKGPSTGQKCRFGTSRDLQVFLNFEATKIIWGMTGERIACFIHEYNCMQNIAPFYSTIFSME